MDSPPPIFLAFQGPAGDTSHIQLPRAEPCATTYLPDECKDGIALSCLRSTTNSLVRIQVFPYYLLLSVWDTAKVSILTCSGDLIDLPMSTIADQKSLILLDGSQFVAPSGRWTVQFDLDHSGANSMNPPARPTLDAANDQVIEKEVLTEISLQHSLHGPHEDLVFTEESDHENRDTDNDHTHQQSSALIQHAPQASHSIGLNTIDSQRFFQHGMKILKAQKDENVLQPYPRGCPKLFHREAGEESQVIPQQTPIRDRRRATDQNLQKILWCEPSHNFPRSDSPDELRALPCETEPDVLSLSLKEEPSEIPKKRPIDHANLHTELFSQGTNDVHHVDSYMEHPRELIASTQHTKFTAPSTTRDDFPVKRRRTSVETSNNTLTGNSTKNKAVLKDQHNNTKSGIKSHQTASNTVKGRFDTIGISVPKIRAVTTDESETHMPVIDIPQSGRSKRRSSSKKKDGLSGNPRYPHVLFSTNCTIQQKKNNIRSFVGLGGKVVDNVADADILCVPTGELKKTPKLILAIVLGKLIVTEEWIVQTHRQNAFPDPAAYLPKDKTKEAQWGFRMVDTISRSRDSDSENSRIIENWNVYMTPQLQAKLSDLLGDFVQIVSAIGASKVHMRLPSTKARPNRVLVLGDENDSDALTVRNLGYDLHSKDVLIMAALRGRLEADSKEFKLELPIKEEEDSQG